MTHPTPRERHERIQAIVARGRWNVRQAVKIVDQQIADGNPDAFDAPTNPHADGENTVGPEPEDDPEYGQPPVVGAIRALGGTDDDIAWLERLISDALWDATGERFPNPDRAMAAGRMLAILGGTNPDDLPDGPLDPHTGDPL